MVSIEQRETLVALEFEPRQSLRPRSDIHSHSCRCADRGRATQLAKLAHDVKAPLAKTQMLLRELGTEGRSAADLRRLASRWSKILADDIERATQLLEAMQAPADQVIAPALPTDITTDIQGPIEASVEQVCQMHRSSALEVCYRWQHRGNTRFDSISFSRVVENIAGNALEAMGGVGKLVISSNNVTGGDREWIKVSINNDGPLIPPALLDRLFDEYQTSGKPRGTGLGLAIVKDLVTSFGGQVWATSSAASGTGFHLLLPVDNV